MMTDKEVLQILTKRTKKTRNSSYFLLPLIYFNHFAQLKWIRLFKFNVCCVNVCQVLYFYQVDLEFISNNYEM